MKRYALAVETDSGGDGTAMGDLCLRGKLYAVEYQPGTLDGSNTFALTCEGVASKPLLTVASPGASTAWYYPREVMHAVANGATLTGSAGGDCVQPILEGYPKIVVSSGGAVAAGQVVFYWED